MRLLPWWKQRSDLTQALMLTALVFSVLASPWVVLEIVGAVDDERVLKVGQHGVDVVEAFYQANGRYPGQYELRLPKGDQGDVAIYWLADDARSYSVSVSRSGFLTIHDWTYDSRTKTWTRHIEHV